jgi:hypothetical protein
MSRANIKIIIEITSILYLNSFLLIIFSNYFDFSIMIFIKINQEKTLPLKWYPFLKKKYNMDEKP